jgi:hypothetical protein
MSVIFLSDEGCPFKNLHRGVNPDMIRLWMSVHFVLPCRRILHRSLLLACVGLHALRLMYKG